MVSLNEKKIARKFVTALLNISFYALFWQELVANKFGDSRSKDKRDNIKDYFLFTFLSTRRDWKYVVKLRKVRIKYVNKIIKKVLFKHDLSSKVSLSKQNHLKKSEKLKISVNNIGSLICLIVKQKKSP